MRSERSPKPSEGVGIFGEQDRRGTTGEYTFSARVLVGGETIHDIAAVIKDVPCQNKRKYSANIGETIRGKIQGIKGGSYIY